MTTPAWTYKSGLPVEIGTKLEKTGQTRGAGPSQVYQNRVSRSGTVLIPFDQFQQWKEDVVLSAVFKEGHIVLISPEIYFSNDPPLGRPDLPEGLILGRNLLLRYDTRDQWNRYPPHALRLSPAEKRRPLEGEYIARVSSTTSKDKGAIYEGFTTENHRGAGIRVYEYASVAEVRATRLQLAFLAWRTSGIMELAAQRGVENPGLYKDHIDKACLHVELADIARLQKARILNADEVTICPLCLKPILATELASRGKQAEGREVHNSTFTTANLFHVDGLHPGRLNHKRYNLGWGHHECNTVARDRDLQWTLNWMREVIARNDLVTPLPAVPGDAA